MMQKVNTVVGINTLKVRKDLTFNFPEVHPPPPQILSFFFEKKLNFILEIYISFHFFREREGEKEGEREI